MKTVVLKLGGSLYDLPDLGQRIATLVEQHAEHRFLIFPGGGDAADLVRGWQQRFRWDDERSHSVALASLDLNATMLAHVLHRGLMAYDHEHAEAAWQQRACPVLAPTQFLRLHDFGDLPHDWTVTSDSLAAWTAVRWPAEELWLCKSVPRPTSLADAVNEGVVDPHFAELAPRLPCVRWCDLRTGSRVDELKRAGSASDGSL
ncbi:MAG TPA: hypothetical protein VFG20_12015 [Planctomycetaceae bacterium]|nr:hypothetical protein [Planctomycetaceae bacterium]